MSPEPFLQEPSPHGNADAIVEDDGRVVYLYLRFQREIERPLRSVWVRNRLPAPPTLDVTSMRQGLLPLMPIARCRHPGPQPSLVEDDLRLVWMPEGDGVALYEAGSLLAAIVPWSGQPGFDGFARDAVGEGPLAWELAPDNPLHERFALAQAWWDRWATDESMWPRIRDPLLVRYESTFGPHVRYLAFDGGQWPPKAVAWMQDGARIALLTLGACVRPQPAMELAPLDARGPDRIELGALLPAALEEPAIADAAHVLSSLSDYPWEYVTWLGHGRVLECELWKDGNHPGLILADSVRWGRRIELPACHGERVTLLWAVPLTRAQLAAAKAGGVERVLSEVG